MLIESIRSVELYVSLILVSLIVAFAVTTDLIFTFVVVKGKLNFGPHGNDFHYEYFARIIFATIWE